MIKQRRFARRLQADDRDDKQFPILNAQIMKKTTNKNGLIEQNESFGIKMTMKQDRPAHSARCSCQETLEVHR
jgi:hypothetical protein